MAQLKAAVLQALAPFATSTGGVLLRDTFHYVTAVPQDSSPWTKDKG
jgi:hypothetical protein